jgi:hypothetical protein
MTEKLLNPMFAMLRSQPQYDLYEWGYVRIGMGCGDLNFPMMFRSIGKIGGL